LKKQTSKLSIELIENRTGVKWENIANLAELYAELKPSATMIGIGGQKTLYGFESVRAISLIPALVGLHRGFYYTNSKGWNVNLSYLTGESLTDKKCKVVSQVALGKHLEAGEFKFMYIYNMNPAETLPNQKAVRKGLAREDVFVVVHDTHWTETAKLADLVLPAPTFLEKEDVVISYSHRYVRKSHRVIQPLGESKSELWVTTKVAEKLNLEQMWIYEEPWKAVEKALKNAFENGSFQDLKNGKTLKLKMKPQRNYQTSTRKIEFYSLKAKSLGLTPLPKPRFTPKKDGFTLLNTAIRKYTHTQFQDVYGPIPPTVLINPKDAERHHIREGDLVELYNELGSITLKALISNSVPRGALWAPRECKDINGKPQNTIVPSFTQKLGGGPVFNTTMVNIKKLH